MPRIRNALARLLPRRTMLHAEAKASRTGPLIAFETLGRPVWTPRDYSAFAREGFMQNAVVYRSVRMIAEAAASIPLLLYEGEAEHAGHPFLDLIKKPNGEQTGADFFETWYGFLLVSGNAYVEAVALGDSVRELHVLRPDRMKVIPGAEGWPEAYEYTAGGQAVRFAGEVVAGVRSVLHLKLFHPVNDHYGLSPIEAAATAIDIHNTASAWNKALLDNSARPSGALVYAASAGRMTAEQFERLKVELETSYTGARQAGRPLLLEGGLDWKPLGLSPKDMDFVEAKHAAAREIALALGVPPMLLGIPGDNTYSNYQEAQRAFWRQTVLPLVNRTVKALSNWLSPAYSDGAPGGRLREAESPGASKSTLELRPDLDQVESLAPEREALWARMERTSFLTANEKRAAVGYEALDTGGDLPGAPPASKPPSGSDPAILISSGKPGLAPSFKYSPNQPRVPRGHTDGGQWTDGGGGGASSSSDGSPGERTSGLSRAREDAQASDAEPEQRPEQDDDSGRRVTNRYASDGTLAGQTVRNRDGSTIESEYRTADSTDDWDERHTLTTADGETYQVTTAGSEQRITKGPDGETLVGTSEWTPEGPKMRHTPAYAGPAKKAVEALLALGTWLSSRNSEGQIAVLGFRASEFAPGEPEPIWVGVRTREDVDRAYPRHGEVQNFTDEAADTVSREGNYIGAADYGTKVHTRIRDEIKKKFDPNLRAEVSLLKVKEETYGKKGTVRVDVLEKTEGSTVCVYDIKTGRRGLSKPRMTEIAANVQKAYPGTTRIIVIETRPSMK